MLVYALTEPVKAVLTVESVIPLVLVWVAYMFSSGFNYFAIKRLEVSTNILFAQIALVISFIGAVIFFKDQVTILRILGAVLVIIATSLIFIQKNSFAKINKDGLVYRVIASTAFAASTLLDKNNINNFSIGIYTSMAYIAPGVISFFVSRASIKEYFAEVGANWIYIVGVAVSSVIAYYCTLKAFGYIDASLTFTIVNFSTVITVFIGVIFFKERKDLLRKFIALIIVMIAAVLLNNSL